MHFLSVRRLTVIVAALAGALILTGPASAAGKKTESPFLAQIKELHDIKVLLELADRDYKGHRAEAVRHIGHAIHALEAGHKHHHGKNVRGGGEPQALSDAQLRESVKALNAVLIQLSGAPGVHATKGAIHVTSAIKELEIALTIR
jgi:hypothetical protein